MSIGLDTGLLLYVVVKGYEGGQIWKLVVNFGGGFQMSFCSGERFWQIISDRNGSESGPCCKNILFGFRNLGGNGGDKKGVM